MLAVVTFDLHGAQPKYYGRVKKLLGRLRLRKHIRVRDRSYPSHLPANTFAAKFSGEWKQKTAADLRDHLRDEVCRAIDSLGLQATVFVAIGDNWAWGRRNVGKAK